MPQFLFKFGKARSSDMQPFPVFVSHKVLLVAVAICCCIIIRNSFITLSLDYGIWPCPADLGEKVIRQNSDISAAV